MTKTTTSAPAYEEHAKDAKDRAYRETCRYYVRRMKATSIRVSLFNTARANTMRDADELAYLANLLGTTVDSLPAIVIYSHDHDAAHGIVAQASPRKTHDLAYSETMRMYGSTALAPSVVSSIGKDAGTYLLATGATKRTPGAEVAPPAMPMPVAEGADVVEGGAA